MESSSEPASSSEPRESVPKLETSRKTSAGKPKVSQGPRKSIQPSANKTVPPKKPSSVQRPPPGWKPSNSVRATSVSNPPSSLKGPQKPERQVLRPPRTNGAEPPASTMTRSTSGKSVPGGVVTKGNASGLRQPTVLAKTSQIPTSRLQQPRKIGGLP